MVQSYYPVLTRPTGNIYHLGDHLVMEQKYHVVQLLMEKLKLKNMYYKVYCMTCVL